MKTRELTFMAIISCIAYLLTFFKVPVSFLSYEIKDVIITVATIYLGFKYGIIISLVVAFLEMVTNSGTFIIGFLMNFLSTICYVLPIAYFYKKNSLLKGVIIGTISMTVVMFIFNIVMTPLYLGYEIKETLGLLFTLITPFNIIKGVLNGILILFTVKPLLNGIRKIKYFKEG